VLFLENVRNTCKPGSLKTAFRLKAQSSHDSSQWATALESSINQATAARNATISFPTVAENIFDKYKQTEVNRNNNQSQIHSALSARSGNESTTSSAVQSLMGPAVSVDTKFPAEILLDGVQVFFHDPDLRISLFGMETNLQFLSFLI
jgi:hypothetical protein